MKTEQKECLQHKYGPTPCFKIDVHSTICSLNFCPVAQYLIDHPEKNPFDVLHSHCVMSDTYGLQKDFEQGKGEYIATVALLKK